MHEGQTCAQYDAWVDAARTSEAASLKLIRSVEY